MGRFDPHSTPWGVAPTRYHHAVLLVVVSHDHAAFPGCGPDGQHPHLVTTSIMALIHEIALMTHSISQRIRLLSGVALSGHGTEGAGGSIVSPSRSIALNFTHQSTSTSA